MSRIKKVVLHRPGVDDFVPGTGTTWNEKKYLGDCFEFSIGGPPIPENLGFYLEGFNLNDQLRVYDSQLILQQ